MEARLNTVDLKVPRTVLVGRGVVLFWGIVERSPRIALLGDEVAGLLLRPFRACALGGFHPGLRFAPPWATILRRFAA